MGFMRKHKTVHVRQKSKKKFLNFMRAYKRSTPR